jgi:zinc transport system substrate-binding protein
MKKVAIIITILLLIFVAIFAVTKDRPEDQSTSPSEEQLTVVTSFYPLYYLTSEILGDSASVINIGGNSNPHSFTPSAKDIITMQKADLVILQGAGLEPWGEDIEHQLEDAGVPVLVAAEHLDLFELTDSEEHHDEEEGHEHEDEHDHGAHDPHTWLDPVQSIEIVELVKKELVAISPENSAVYTTNADMLLEKLNELKAAYDSTLSSCTIEEALVSHNAFGYVARRYGLTMHPIAGISTEDEPSAALLAELKAEAEDGVYAVLTEENSVKEYAETIARETGITLLPVNALGAGVTESEGDYIDVLYSNLQSLKEAYGCN